MTPSEVTPSATGDVHTTEESVLRLDSGDLLVRRDGPRDAPALLLVHGSATSGRSWDALVPFLTPSHHVIRVDLPGHGRSAEPAGRAYDTSEQARTLGTALDRLGVAHVLAVGHSSGGCAVTALAERRPDLVTALVLVNTGPALDAFIAAEPMPLDPARWPPTDDQIRRFASTGFRAGHPVPQELVDELRGMTHHAVTASMRATTDYLKKQALPDRLAVLGKPLLVVFGDQDRRWRPASAADYRVVPGARVELLPGAGHTPILEEPRRTAALLLDFAETHSAPGADSA
ncbi:alpha/beta hydrolase [Streptomyces sp. WAC04189]|uniref:Alpha/beta fold hydrolase n=2 Tax=Streptomyces rochei TaxID=1928 RepID=A0ABW7E313_STRRO|nr:MULTISPECIES: alpha/beta fold hydrolase [unclassified Streptomyces]RSS01988.1 alpha/beta hydrolase [Streptomyces sp. WAC04189]